MDRVDKTLHAVNRNGRGLEIGPSYNPVVSKASGARVETVDHATRDELVAKYRGFGLGQEQLDRIEEVDHIWHGGSLLNVVPEHGVYDYIVASHFIEHTVDLIGFLQDCESLLNETGQLALVVPDKRFCFDRFQPLSTLGSVIDSHHAAQAFHSAGPLVDHQAYACTNNSVIAWSRDAPGPLAVQFPHLEGAAEAELNGAAQEEYFDIHRWKFTPASFDLLIRDLAVLGHHQFGIVESFGTEGFEFFVTLGKDAPADPAADRLAALLRIEDEVAAVHAEVAIGPKPPESLDDLQAENAKLRREVDELRASTSWRVTQPLRAASAGMRRVRHRAGRRIS